MANVLAEDAFLIDVERMKREIEANFARSHQILEERERELSTELEELEEKYKGDAVKEQLEELSKLKQIHVSTVRRNENKEFIMQKVAEFDAHMNEIRVEFERERKRMKRVTLEWDEELENKLKDIGRVNLQNAPVYKGKGTPVMVACKNATQKCQLPNVFYFPRTVFIEPETDKVFICDLGNDRVQVFNKSLEFLMDFNGNMSGPYGICIYKVKVYVTQHSGNNMNVYTPEGKYIKSVGTKGMKELEFDCPKGISIDADIIYICDYKNNRIQCLNLDLEFNSMIPDIPCPRDVKITMDEIIVLLKGEYCIRFYNKHHQKLREVISSGEGKQVVAPYVFCLDSENNILLIDNTSHSVLIFTKTGELIHKFGKMGEERGDFIHPVGIALDSDDRIIVTSRNTEHCVQLF